MKRWESKHIDFVKNAAGLLSGEAYKQFCATFPDFPVSYKAFAKQKCRQKANKAVSKKLKWTPEMLDFIKSTAGQDRETAYKAFCEKYTGITATAFYNQRSRSGVSPKKPHGTNKRAKLYEERIKAGYVHIKVAEPSTWKSKSRWVWEETHPAEPTKKNDNFIFLNGNKRDFRPENIERVESKYRTVFLQYGGVDSDPQITRIRLAQARIRAAQLDLGEKLGTVRTYGGRGRVEVQNVRKPKGAKIDRLKRDTKS